MQNIKDSDERNAYILMDRIQVSRMVRVSMVMRAMMRAMMRMSWWFCSLR